MRENMDTDTPITWDTAALLLKPATPSVFISAEEKRPWGRIWASALRHLFPGSVLDELWDSPLLRTYDQMSGSQPDDAGRMLARDPRCRLDRDEARAKTLAKHANHKIREDTPYISFTNSPQSLQDLANWRTNNKNRGDQWIVVVDPRVRFELRLPILQYSEEMRYYSIERPYGRDYWSNHYLCVWEVTPEEVVAFWRWEDLRSNPNWYEEVIVPAVIQSRWERDHGQAERSNLQRDTCVETNFSDSSDDTDDSQSLSDSEESYDRDYDEHGAGLALDMCKLLTLE